MHQVVGLGARIAPQGERLRQHDAAPAVAARIEQQHVIVGERRLEPVPLLERSRAGESGPSLEKHEPGALRIGVFAVLDRARENRQRLARGPVVIERHDELEVGQVHAVMAHVSERTERGHAAFSW